MGWSVIGIMISCNGVFFFIAFYELIGLQSSVGTSREFPETSELELFEILNQRVRAELELYLMILEQKLGSF